MNECSVYNAVDIISKKWSLLILFYLYKGSSKYKRYSELKKNLSGITSKILSYRLKELEKDSLVTKKIDVKSFPVKSFYSLTPQGTDMVKIIKELKKWSVKWKMGNVACASSDCKNCTSCICTSSRSSKTVV